MTDEEVAARPPRRWLGVAIGVVGVALVVGAAVVVLVVRDDRSDRPVATGPNVVVIMTDDQTLRSLAVMERTRALIGDEGTTFARSFSSFPNCCPSRATYLTGQYAHNHGVRDNVRPAGGAAALDATETLPVWLQRAGYQTIHIGKYLNGWGQDNDIAPEPGWDRWFSLIDPSTYRYYEFQVSVDGERRRYGEDEADYSTDVLADEAVAQIRERADDDRPFFLSFTPLAPHAAAAEREAGTAGSGARRFGFPVAPQRHLTTYVGRGLDYGEAVDQEDVSSIPEELRRDRLSPQSLRYIERYEVAELGALAAVDEAVDEIVTALDDEGVLDDTLIVFTSDNGLFHGEHRVVTGKFLLYEPSVAVPLLVRGPGFERGAVVETPTVNADLAPTILAVAGASGRLPSDGVDLSEALDVDADRAVLLENFTKGEPNSAAVRTRRWAYIEHPTGETELFDMEADPDQVRDLSGNALTAEVEAALAEVLDDLRGCAGADCSVPVPEVLA